MPDLPEATEVEPAPPEAEAHHVRLMRLANAATMLLNRLKDLTPEEREEVGGWIDGVSSTAIGSEDDDALDAILIALGAGD